jgi:DedD protein
MRDTHRLKEKYELTLDNHQIVVLTVVALVLIGGAFALGVTVGKKLAVDQPAVAAAAAPADILAAVDQKTDALDDMAKDASLTFHDTLTKPAPEPEVAEAPKPAPTQPIATANPPPAPEAGQVKTDPVPTRTTDAGDLKQAFGRAQAKPADTAEDGTWTLQLSASQDSDEADRFAAGLRDKGYAPFIVRADVPGRGVWFRVRMGRFPSKDAAMRYLADFQRETQMEAFVTPLK